MADESGAKTNAGPFKRLKLLIFGGTGATGKEFVKQALDLGHDVTVIARSPEKLQEMERENLKVVQGDAYQSETYESEIAEKDAVVSCLGPTGKGVVGPFAQTTLYSDTIQPILNGMKEHGVKRFVVLSSWCTRTEPNNPRFFEWFLRPMLLGGVLKNLVVMEEILEKTDPADINYTIVRPPRLSNDAGNQKYKIEEGLFIPDCGRNADIPRADVAHFMLRALQSDEYDRKEISVASL